MARQASVAPRATSLRNRRRPRVAAVFLSALVLGSSLPASTLAAPSNPIQAPADALAVNQVSAITAVEPAPVQVALGGGIADHSKGEVLADGTTIRPASPAYVPPKAATEVTSLRDENSRVTANPDGTFSLEASSGRLNFQDSTGSWQPIDLTLVPDATTGQLTVKSLDLDVIIGNDDSSLVGSVAGKTGTASLRAIGYAGGKQAGDPAVVVFQPDSTSSESEPGTPSPAPAPSKPSASTSPPATVPSASAAPSAAPAPSSEPTSSPSPTAEPSPTAIVAPEREPSEQSTGEAHLTAAGNDRGLEFGAEIHDKTSPRTFAFVLTVDEGTTVEPAPDRGALLLNRVAIEDGAPRTILAGRVSAPIVSDADAVGPTEAVVVDVLRKGDKASDPVVDQTVLDGLAANEVVLRYRLDDTWLDDPARVFPVRLDPTLCIQHGSTTCNPSTHYLDTYGGDNQASTYPTSPSTLRVGYDAIGSPDAAWGLMRSYIYFDQVSLADGAQVTSASMVLRQDINRDGANRNFLARPMKTGWGDTSSWNQLHDKVYTGLDSPNVLSCATDGTNCDLVFDVSKAVRAWYTRRAADWKADVGFEVKQYAEDSSHAESDFYVGDDPSTIGGRPELRITYVIPKVQLDFATELGPNYAPSAMVAGQTAKLPLRIKNNTSGFSFNACTAAADADCYQFGWRFFDAKGVVVSQATNHPDLPSTISSGATVALTLAVTPPTTTGSYTLRLDLVHRIGGSAGTLTWASDWATPSLFYSRNKKILSSDNTRWTGSSVIERDEFGIEVSNGANEINRQTVGTGDGGSLGIDLATRNLHYEGAGGVGFADLVPVGLDYGYDSRNASSCTGYQGVLDACGWYTNYDERLTDTSAAGNAGDFTYQGSSGTRYFMGTDAQGQISGSAPVLVERPRITFVDENGLTANSLVNAVTAGVAPAPSGTSVAKFTTTTTMTNLAAYVPKVDLNVYRSLSFSIRTSGAGGAGIAFKIHNATGDPADYPDTWLAYTAGNVWTTQFSAHQINLGGSVANVWKTVSARMIYDDVRAQGLGGSLDRYEITGFAIGSSSAATTYLDATWFGPTANTAYAETKPTFNVNDSLASEYLADQASGAKSLKVNAAALSASPTCTASPCWGVGVGLYVHPFVSWNWRKVGGDSVAVQFNVKDLRTSAVRYLTYYAGPTVPPGAVGTDRLAIQVSDVVPTEWTKVTRNLLEDARQVFNFYYDTSAGATSSAPPTQGPIADDVTWTGYIVSAVNGSFALFDDVISSSLPDPGQSGADDFRVTYADRSVHTFGRDGLLHQIVDRDGNAVTVVWDYNSTVANSQANYTIDKIRADTDGDVSGTWTYQRQIDVSTGLGTGGSPSTVTFAESLGSTGTGGTTPTGRSTEFKVATAASTGVGIGDVISIQPARRPTTCASSGASGCSLFSYSDSTSHRLAFVADPRWDQLTSGSNGYRFGITADFGTDPTTINDQSRSGAPLLRVLSWDHGGSSTAVRALWQDAAGIAAGAATHVDLTSDGRTLTEYVPQACTAGNCVSNPPTNADATLAGLKRTANEFDGLSQVNRTTQYRNPGTDLVVSRQGSRAGAKVDNFVDPLLGGQVAWTQSSDQYYASLVEGGAPGDVFRTTYTYDAHGAVSHAVRPVANALAAAHFIPVDTETRYDREGHPTQVADTFATNPGFESGTTGWTTTGSVTAYVASTVPDGNVHTGIASVATGTSGSVGQEFKLVPGQTVQLQGWDRTVSGGRADYALEWYAAGWHAFGGSPFTYPSDSSMAGHAWDVHIPTDGDGRVRITISNGTAAGTVYLDDVTAITRWASTTYAASGLPVTQSTLAASGPVTTAFGYDPRSAHPAIYPTTTTANDVATVVDATSEDLTSSATYDPWGRTLVATDPDGVAATTHYLTGSGDGARTDVDSVSNGLGATTTFAYDTVGNKRTTTTPAPLSETTTVTYDLLNHPVTTTTPDGIVTRTEYDAGGQLSRTIANYVDGTPSAGLDDVVTKLSRDTLGRVIRTDVDDARVDAVTEATFDLVGNPISTTVHAGNRIWNGGFEATTTGATDWTINPSWGLRTDASPTFVHAGTNALRAQVPSSPAVTRGDTAGRYRVTPAGSYATSAYVNGYATNSAGAGIGLHVTWVDAAGTTVGDSTVGTVTVGTSQTWQLISATVTAPAGAVDAVPYLSLAASAANDIVWVDDVVFDELRTTTTYVETANGLSRATPTATKLPIAPAGALGPDNLSPPACPNGTGSCNTVTALDLDGRAVATTDALGHTARNLLDLDGHPVATTTNYIDGLNAGSELSSDLTTRTTYTIAGQVETVTDPAGHVSSTAYDPLGRRTRLTDAAGVFTRTTYTKGSRVDRTSAPGAPGTADANLVWSRTLYDLAGRAIRTLDHYDLTGNAQLQAENFEDGAVSGTKTIDPTVERTWSATGLFVSGGTITLEDGVSSPRSGEGRLKVTTGTGSSGGAEWVLNGTFVSGHTYKATAWLNVPSGTTINAYLGVSGDTGTTTALAGSGTWQALTISWTPTANRTGVSFALKRITATTSATFFVDDVTAWDDSTTTLNPLGTAANIPTETVYDSDDRIVRSVIIGGNPGDPNLVTGTAYDSMGRVTAITVNDSAGAGTGATDTNLATTTTYDALGRASVVTDPRGTVSRYGYDRLGHITSTIENYADGSPTDGATVDDDLTSTFAYDALGELVGSCPAAQVVSGGGCLPGARSEPKAWHYGYDTFGRMTVQVPPDNTSATDLDPSVSVYDTAGRLASTVDQTAGGTVDRHLDYGYDAVGRVLTESLYAGAGTGSLKQTVTRTWLIDGSPASVALAATADGYAADPPTISFTYDPAGRPDLTKSGGTTMTDLDYAADGTISGRIDTLPNVGTTTTTTFGYDWAGRPTTTAASSIFSGAVTNDYRLDGLLAKRTLPSGQVLTYGFDAAKRPTSLALTGSRSFSQTYDRSGNVTSESRSLDAGISGLTGSGTATYAYDALGRLTGETGLGADRAYGYDLDGNRTSVTEAGATRTTTFDRTDQPIAQAKAPVWSVPYSANHYGDMLTAPTINGATTTYTYDTAGRTRTISNGTNTATLAPDALGRVASRTAAGVTDTYGYVGASDTIVAIDGAGTGSTDRLSVTGADGSRLATRDGTTTAFVVADLHGNIAAAMAAGSGSLVDAIRYDAYGKTLATPYAAGSGSVSLDQRYQGRLDLAPANSDPLYGFGARDYAPVQGSFTSLDSVLGSAAAPRSLNRFLYALANPATFIDPTGHQAMRGDGGGYDNPALYVKCGPSKCYDPPNSGNTPVKPGKDTGPPRSPNGNGGSPPNGHPGKEGDNEKSTPAAGTATVAALPSQGGGFDLGGFFHTALDVVGVVDPTGIADAANGLYYAAEGDQFNAAISFGAAVLPYAGDGLKALRLVKHADVLADFVVHEGDDVARFAAHEGAEVVERLGREGDDVPEFLYRGGSDTPDNLTPSLPKDAKGLSVFDTPEAAFGPKGRKAQKIRTSKLDCLCAFREGDPGHFNLRPRDASEVEGWGSVRGTGQAHPYTQEIIDSIVGVVRKR